MDLALLVDFGSTYTKLALIDLEDEALIATAQSLSTVKDNMMNGFKAGLATLLDSPQCRCRRIEESSINCKLACSSAAGGLQLVAIGLIPQLTLEAARRAALGAGAKVVGSYSHQLTDADIATLEQRPCDVILLSGGTDGGESATVTHNARMLANCKLDIPFIVAANRVASPEVGTILRQAGKHVVMTENVLPELDRINVEPAREAIRDTFVHLIVKAKGLDKAQEYLGDILMPTPMATLKAATLLARGSEEPGLGELMVIEIGGATTNVHSVAEGNPTQTGVLHKGLPEPYAKRTVEGDLGIRYNAATIVELAGVKRMLGNIPGTGQCVDQQGLKDRVNFLSTNVGFIPRKETDFALDIGLARTAVDIAVQRHVGTCSQVYTPEGPVIMQHGKDLTCIQTVIGTGGIFAYGRMQEFILQAACFSLADPMSLRPRSPNMFADNSYILYATGLLSDVSPDKALRVAKKHLRRVYPQSG